METNEFNTLMASIQSEIDSTEKQVRGSDENVNISGETEDYQKGYLAGLEFAKQRIEEQVEIEGGSY